MAEIIELAEMELPYLTDPALRIGGTIKNEPEDFIVEEVPAYQPSGEGDHLYLWIEKRDTSAEQLLMHLSKTLGVHRNDIGVAGLKDRRAVTRQWVSVPIEHEGSLQNVDTDSIHILESSYHTNKLKTGHLQGNRFTITLHETASDSLEKAELIRNAILSKGIPNYFGSQRFGFDGETLRTGESLLNGTLRPESIPRQRRKFLSRLSLSAVQSALFNAILASRIKEGTTHTVQLGEVLQVVASGGPFVSTEPDVDQVRFDRREVVTSGPIYGRKMKLPENEMLAYEMSFLDRFSLTLESFNKFKKLTPGTRRPLLLYLEDLTIQSIDETTLQFSFALPSGTYATIVLREFMKNDA